MKSKGRGDAKNRERIFAWLRDRERESGGGRTAVAQNSVQRNALGALGQEGQAR